MIGLWSQSCRLRAKASLNEWKRGHPRAGGDTLIFIRSKRREIQVLLWRVLCSFRLSKFGIFSLKEIGKLCFFPWLKTGNLKCNFGTLASPNLALVK